MLYGLALMPMGTVIFADLYLIKRIGLEEFYAERAGKHIHWPPILAWISSLLICVVLWYLAGVQEFFLCLPGWLAAGITYLILSKIIQKPMKEKVIYE